MTQKETNLTLAEKRSGYIPKGHASSATCFIDHGRGSRVFDVEGKEYIDFAGGIAVMNVGHCHPKVVEAIGDQAGKFTHACFSVAPYEAAVRLAEKLCGITPGDFSKSSLLVNSGAEAVENAVKIARYYTGRPAVLAFENAFHGRTLLTMTLTSRYMPYKKGFGPFAPEVYRAPFGNRMSVEGLEDFFVKNVDPESLACIIAEPVQGEAGFITPPADYFGNLSELCKKYGILFVSDEIQSGMGRTGKMFAIEHWGVIPDLVTVAKSLAAGMPLSAVVGRKEIMESVHPGGIGGTYGANPVSCRAALAVLEIFETEGILESARKLAEMLEARLEAWKNDFPMVDTLHGIGAMRAMELVTNPESKTPAVQETKALLQYCQENGVLILSCGAYHNIVRFLMPLNIEGDLLEKGLDIVEAGLKKVAG
jgi:4-aminobutyrate aminotransferase/(S)-3-amino-2-methylpropionate transaminase